MYIKCENVNKTIGKNVILKNVNLSLSGGCIYGLWGKNGSGKTMLMRMLAGLIRPTSGKVCIDGKELTHGFPPSMGILIENPDFLQEYTGFQNLKLLAGLRGVITDAQIREAMEKVPGQNRPTDSPQKAQPSRPSRGSEARDASR